ncbi:MAG: hypothetical protein J1F03_08935 [Oscillospiraceae bacterium]|nr:hypothetical protein [Oscillospiraceae bacterium]
MMNDNNKDVRNDKLSDNSIVPISEQQVHILVTDADTRGTEITKMSDFMGEYAKLQVSSLINSSMTSIMADLPIADMGIINDVIQHARIVAKGDISLIPDFEHLPSDIRGKLKKGLYSIGESKQINGNMRAVILNENGIRIKDITLKKVYNNPQTLETTRNITNQLQMKQINDKLAAIQEIQNYQLDKDRDHAIFTPFLNARDNILHAQNAETQEKRNMYLEKAAEHLIEAKNAIKTEMNTAVNHLAKFSKWPLFRRQSTINTLISHIADDLQFSTKICGITMQVYEYLGQSQNAKIEMEQYQAFMTDFLSNEIGNTGYTAIELLHANFRYNKDNVDCWYDFSIELKTKLSNIKQLESRETYIVTLEDSQDE